MKPLLLSTITLLSAVHLSLAESRNANGDLLPNTLSGSDNNQGQIASETDKNVGQYHGGSMPLVRGDIAPPAQKLSSADIYARLIDEARVPWKEPGVLKGNKHR